jgi:HD-GYP domain-containing protein (c-di-GMP phosphodiesterase class II)
MGTNTMLDALPHPEAIQTGTASSDAPWSGQVWDARLRGFVTNLEARVPGSAGHAGRVAAQSRVVARRLGVDEHGVEGVGRAARVHDVGKIIVPIEILANPGALTPAEHAEIKRHATFGARLVAAVGDPELTAIVRHHHERLDGSGYPDGLRGTAIPIGARIVAVCDAYDSLTTSRPHREALAPVAALRLLRDESGSLFDPAVVAAFAA